VAGSPPFQGELGTQRFLLRLPQVVRSGEQTLKSYEFLHESALFIFERSTTEAQRHGAKKS
jgi:hypothetical protein